VSPDMLNWCIWT